jgi:phospholipase/carboxylesterase
MYAPPTVRWRKAVGGLANERPPLLVLLHGRGADENDLFGLGAAVDPRFAIASVRGPLEAEGARAWFESRGPGRPVAESLRTSIVWLRAWFDSLQGERTAPQRVFLLGFSMGMQMASALTLDEPTRYAGGVLLSGALPFDTDVAIVRDRLAGVPIFHAHGSFDTVIPTDLVARTDSYLRESSGANLTTRDYPIAHEIGELEMRDISTWLTKQVAP